MVLPPLKVSLSPLSSMSTELSTTQKSICPRATRAREVVGALRAIIFLGAIGFVLSPVFVFASGEILNLTDYGAGSQLGGIGEVHWTPIANGEVGSFDYYSRYFQTLNPSHTLFYKLWVWSGGTFTTELDCVSPSQSITAWGIAAYNVGPTNLISVGMSGTECDVDTGTTYGLRANVNGSYTDGNLIYHYGDGPTQLDTYLVVSSATIPDTSTRIISSTPAGGSTQATSSSFTFGSDIYINTNDYDDDWYFRLRYKRNQDDQAAVSLIAAEGGLWNTITWDAPLDIGENNLSTTTDLSEANYGEYTIELQIRKPSWTNSIAEFFGLGNLTDNEIVVSSTTQFTLVQRTAYDIFVASTTAQINEFFASSTLSIADAKAACGLSITGFSITDCLGFLFGWQSQPMSLAIENIKTGFFRYAPWGYITRSVVIMTTTSTSTLPTLTYTFPSSAPSYLANATFSFNPWQYFYTSGAPVYDEIKSNTDDKNIWEIFEPIISLIVYLSLILLIIKDLTHVHPNSKNL